MGQGIASGEAEIVRPGEDLAVLYNDAADGTFTEFDGLFSFFYSLEHKPLLVGSRLKIGI